LTAFFLLKDIFNSSSTLLQQCFEKNYFFFCAVFCR